MHVYLIIILIYVLVHAWEWGVDEEAKSFMKGSMV